MSRESNPRFRSLRRLPRTSFTASVGTVVARASVVVALEPPAPVENPLQTIVVTAKKLTVADEILAKQVVTALHDDPYFPDMHVVVTTDNGVVHLVGFVYDADDMAAAKRIIRRKVPGANVS